MVGARWYDPAIGSWTQEDPARADGNFYGYCGGDPINRWDPSGLCWEHIQETWNANTPLDLQNWTKTLGCSTAVARILKYGTSYIGNYGNIHATELCPDGEKLLKQKENPTTETTITLTEHGYYDRDAAIAYAKQWHNGINEDFYNYSQDCSNFVSQCLLAGGVKMNSDWYSYKGDYSWNIISLFGGYKYNYSWDVAATWRKAHEQYKYFSNAGNGYIDGDIIILSASYIKAFPFILKNFGIQKGDLLYWSKDGGQTAYHATIISSVIADDILYAGHTSDVFDKSLREHKDFLSSHVVFVVKLKNRM
jgi:RHS repeat-associated core domain